MEEALPHKGIPLAIGRQAVDVSRKEDGCVENEEFRSKGIVYRGNGFQIKIWGKKGQLAHSETLQVPYSKAGFTKAVKRREYLTSRKKMGLSLREHDGGIQTFAEVAERWLASLQIDQDTIRGYWNILNQYWMEPYSRLPLCEITQADVMERLAATKLAIKTQKNIVGPLRQVLKHGGANPNPANEINWPKKKAIKRKAQRYLPEERRKIVEALAALSVKFSAIASQNPTQKARSDAHWADQSQIFFPLLFATGLRPGEALGIQWSDYDGENISITKQYTRGKAKDATKTGHDRIVYVPTWVRPILDSHSTRFKAGPLFVGKRRSQLKDTKRLNPIWQEAHRLARVPLREPYVCRHTRASELLSNGVDPAEAAAQLGHSTQMFLETYSTFVAEYQGKRDMSRFESKTEHLPTQHLNTK